MSPTLLGPKTNLFSESGPLIALQIRYLALNPHPITCPSRGTMCRTSRRLYGLRLEVSAKDPPGPPQEDLETVYMVPGG